MSEGEYLRCPGCDRLLVLKGAVDRAAAWHVWNYATGCTVGVELECKECGARAHSHSRAVFQYVARCIAGAYGLEARSWITAYRYEPRPIGATLGGV